ncbi:hypothetical protein Hanom_Chr04g00380531 [Helianthus anomalus]
MIKKLNKMPLSSLRFDQFCDLRPKVCFFHLDPKGLKSCHFHPAHQLHPFFIVKSGVFSSFLIT